MADLRNTFDDILKTYGYNILLIKSAAALADLPDGTTPYQLHTVRSMIPGSSGLANVQQEIAPGVSYDVDMVYYFRYTSNPQEGDLILDSYGRDKSDVQHFRIEWAVPMRGYHGRVEFFTAGATRARKIHPVNT